MKPQTATFRKTLFPKSATLLLTKNDVKKRKRFHHAILSVESLCVNCNAGYQQALWLGNTEHVHPGMSTGSLEESDEKHSTSAASDSEEAKNAPRAIG